MKITKKIIVIEIVLIAVIALMFAYLYYMFQTKDINLQEAIPDIIELKNINNPDPLYGPQSNDSANTLDAQEIIIFTNKEREKSGKEQLIENDILNDAAKDKIDDMFKNQYFEHVSPVDGKDVVYFVNIAGYTYSYVGENLALGDFIDEKELVNAWMDSQGHRENILNDNFTQIGVYAKKGMFNDRDTWLAVQVFAKSAPNCNLPDQNLKNIINEYEFESINNTIAQLNKEAESLIILGNEKIEMGNEILQQTNDTEQAKPYWEEGKLLQEQGREKLDEISKLLDDYNDIKSIIEQYNSQVEDYNNCIHLN